MVAGERRRRRHRLRLLRSLEAEDAVAVEAATVESEVAAMGLGELLPEPLCSSVGASEQEPLAARRSLPKASEDDGLRRHSEDPFRP